ncbi:hypothetical protein N7519_001808 [Penicillium mononematosum]|uniref:uncharacterized protein n=1 Tax=Penicillium mononematosum TaxID=268346 RepID=UPI002549A088|nr:uncharacterized protein N7519_001808 [Penicillium mononematosum]KAJ6186900.1 hypothetical protein N7519_001808 [Penicillium mononematosum]
MGRMGVIEEKTIDGGIETDVQSKVAASTSGLSSTTSSLRGRPHIPWPGLPPSDCNPRVSSNDRVQLVDIGGGLGHDLAGLKRKFPNIPGRLVLEDLPDVIEHAKESIEDGIEVSLLALARVREAMADDSVLLINENTLPEVGASSFSVSLDINIMSIFAALERTEKQWVDLLEWAGFRVVKIWRADYDGV